MLPEFLGNSEGVKHENIWVPPLRNFEFSSSSVVSIADVTEDNVVSSAWSLVFQVCE